MLPANPLTRRVVFSALYCIALSAFIATALPKEEARSLVMQGIPSTFKTCGRSCDEGIQIQSKRFACSADLFGPAYNCPQTFQSAAEASATYFQSLSLLSVIGVSEPANLLVRLEQGDRLVYVKSPSEYRSQALWQSWGFYALFAAALCALLRLPYFHGSQKYAAAA